MDLLKVKAVSKTYGSGEAAVHALKKASFTVPKGEFVAIVGESGSGKTTLLNMIGALDTPTSGKVFIDGKDIFAMKEKRLTIFRRRNIGFIFQSFNLIPELTVEQNMIFPVLLDYQKPDKRYLEELLSVLNLKERRHHLPGQLSGGQQQRAAIARALVQRARVLLADEPIASLDPESSRNVMETLRDLNRNDGLTVVVTLHQVDYALAFCPRTIALKHGRVVFDGPSAELTPSFLKQLYGTECDSLFARPESDIRRKPAFEQARVA